MEYTSTEFGNFSAKKKNIEMSSETTMASLTFIVCP
jgi:hypothetical protein